MLYLTFKWLHILSAILALGSNLTYRFWLSRATRFPETLVYTLRSIQALDRALANRGYAALLVTGITMFVLGHWPLTTSWLVVALVLYVTVAVLGALVFAPAMRKQIQLAEEGGVDSVEYRSVAQRTAQLGMLTIAIVIIIVFLMVFKPHFWG